MFCPKCKAEYRKGFYRCAHCQVDLVDALPPEPELEPEYVDYEEVLATYNPADVAFLKSLLDAEGVIYYFLGEHFSYMRPLADPTRLMVKKDQAESERELLKDADLAYMGINLETK